jgi:transmembrane sensor
MDNARQAIQERAVVFLQRREGPEWGEADHAEFTAWLEASTAHRVAFLRAEAAWEEIGRLKAVAAGLPRQTVPTPAELDALQFGADRLPSTSVTIMAAVPPRVNKKILAGGTRIGVALAASLLVGIVAVLAVYPLWFAGERYATPVGGVASVPLADGSHITLNTASTIRVSLSETERHIELSRGEAFFEVAHDPNRPFVVQVGGKRVIAVGTEFSVRRQGDDDIQVVVTEGKVRIETPEHPKSSAAATTASRERAVFASAGTIARVGGSGISTETEPAAAAEEILSWRSGYVTFHDTPLAGAIAEFNRYNARQIVIQDPAVAAMPLTGKFRATNNEAFVDLLEQTYHLSVRRTSKVIFLGEAAAP